MLKRLDVIKWVIVRVNSCYFLKLQPKVQMLRPFSRSASGQIVKGSDDLVRQKTFIFSIHNTHGWKIEVARFGRSHAMWVNEGNPICD